jgi:hypothetical protein
VRSQLRRAFRGFQPRATERATASLKTPGRVGGTRAGFGSSVRNRRGGETLGNGPGDSNHDPAHVLTPRDPGRKLRLPSGRPERHPRRSRCAQGWSGSC